MHTIFTSIFPPIFRNPVVRRAGVIAALGLTTLGCGEMSPTPTVRRVVTADVETPLALQVTPRATCTLHSDDDGDGALQLVADDRGVIRVYARSAAAAVTELSLDCSAADGGITSTALEVRAGDRRDDAPEPTVAPIGTALPVLADADLITDQEVVARGYPPRPDRQQQPGAYAAWRRLVSRPHTAVSAGDVPADAMAFGNTTLNWTGTEVEKYASATAKYNFVSAVWTVAPVAPTPAALGLSKVGAWIGIDTMDIEQEGTAADSIASGGTTISHYYAWVEAFPGPPYVRTNFPVGPGDQLSGYVYVSGSWSYYVMYNYRTGASVSSALPLPSGYTGRTAEFFMERPTSNGVLPPLANFGITIMSGCEYGDTAGVISNLFYGGSSTPSSPPDSHFVNWTMINKPGGNQGPVDTLAESSITNFGQPGTSDVIFYWRAYR